MRMFKVKKLQPRSRMANKGDENENDGVERLRRLLHAVPRSGPLLPGGVLQGLLSAGGVGYNLDRYNLLAANFDDSEAQGQRHWRDFVMRVFPSGSLSLLQHDRGRNWHLLFDAYYFAYARLQFHVYSFENVPAESVRTDVIPGAERAAFAEHMLFHIAMYEMQERDEPWTAEDLNILRAAPMHHLGGQYNPGSHHVMTIEINSDIHGTSEAQETRVAAAAADAPPHNLLLLSVLIPKFNVEIARQRQLFRTSVNNSSGLRLRIVRRRSTHDTATDSIDADYRASGHLTPLQVLYFYANQKPEEYAARSRLNILQ